MDLNTINKSINYALKRKKPIIFIAALACSTYGAYKVYNSPSIIKTRNQAFKILSALASVSEFVGDSAETLSVISKDLKHFIQSDTHQIPCSLKQVFKITKSDEVSESIVSVTKALIMGFSRGWRITNHGSGSGSGSRFYDRALDKLFSPAGTGFVSVIVGSFSRNMVMGIYATGSGRTGEKWVELMSDEKVRKMVGECVHQFVATMVTVYLDKTMEVNIFDEILSSLTNPKHDVKVRNMLGLICNGAVETFVRTSHQVLTNTKSNIDSNANANATSSYLFRGKVLGGQEVVLSKLTPGKVTLATVKSFMGFLLNQFYDSMKTRFLEVYRYINAKSMVVMTVGVSVYLHMLSGPWSLMQV